MWTAQHIEYTRHSRRGIQRSARTQSREYLQHLPHAPRDVLVESLADKLYNARSILLDLHQDGDRVFERFSVGKEDQLWYYRTLATAFRDALRGDSLILIVAVPPLRNLVRKCSTRVKDWHR